MLNFSVKGKFFKIQSGLEWRSMKDKIFKPIRLSVDLCRSVPNITGSEKPVFSWGAQHGENNQFQSAYKITAYRNGGVIWDSGFVETSEQSCVYDGEELFDCDYIEWKLVLKDKDGYLSKSAVSSFIVSFGSDFKAKWISAKECKVKDTHIFAKKFGIEKKVERAVLKICGIGIHEVYLNGKRIDDNYFQPIFTSYNKRAYYTVLGLDGKLFGNDNSISVILACGNRLNLGKWSEEMLNNHPVPLFGQPVLSSELVLFFGDGTSETICTDETWKYAEGFVKSHLFEGEIFDERLFKKALLKGDFEGKSVKIQKCPAENMYPQSAEVEKVVKTHKPVAVVPIRQNKFFVDFGVNISGVCRIKIPPTKNGDEIILRHSEMLSDNCTLYTENLRSAYSVDKFIAKKSERTRIWNPHFTYHGFRYVEVEGIESLTADDIEALEIHSDMILDGNFVCSNQVLNAVQKAIVRTELDNIHGLFTDCPQRDERQGWMNDATVRFEEVPYNFYAAKMFEKVVGDCVSEQGENGEFTCTAPYFYGEIPADPVCSASIVALYKNLMFYGDFDTARKYIKSALKWNDYLESVSVDGIVNYSHYGDWAGPADCCKSFEDAHSSVTSGQLMSSCFHLYNCIMLAEIARMLKMYDVEERCKKRAEFVRRKITEKFCDENTGLVDTGSQGSQAIALKTGLLSEDVSEKTAEIMNNAVKSAGYRITTGNLNTKFLIDMLSEYGYTDTAFSLMTREEYPSIGYMLRCGATTVWERFENKKNSEMNSHNHPMYGACGSWFYEYLAGISPKAPGFGEIVIKPHFPKDLHYVQASLETVKGQIYVKWQRSEENIKMDVYIPFGTKALIYAEKEHKVGSGFYSFVIKE